MPFCVRRSVADTLEAQDALVEDGANVMPSAPSLEQQDRSGPGGRCLAPTLADLAKCGPGSFGEEVNLKTGIS